MEIIWRVIKDCKFVGYVVSLSMMRAQFLAEEKYGSNCFVESTLYGESKNGNSLDSSNIESNDE